MPSRFVIIASQRTGSTLLVRSLDADPQVFCAGELFHIGQAIHHAEFRYCYPYIGSRTLARFTGRIGSRARIARHLRRFYEKPRPYVQATGFKLMLSQIRTLPVVVPVLKELGARFVFLYREDSFAAAMSYYTAKVTRRFHSDQVPSATATSGKPIEEAKLAQLVHACRKEKVQLIEMHEREGGCLITYEGLRANWVDTISTIGREIGLQQLKVCMALERLSNESRAVPKYDETELRRKFDCDPP